MLLPKTNFLGIKSTRSVERLHNVSYFRFSEVYSKPHFEELNEDTCSSTEIQ